jgi:hypothetical protein
MQLQTALRFSYTPRPMTQQPLEGQVPLTVEISRSHLDTPYSVGILSTSDQPDAEPSA